MPDNNLTHITVLLDKSGSMQVIRDATIEGFNGFLSQHKERGTKGTISLFTFDAPPFADSYQLVYKSQSISSVRRLEKADYVPRGSTALLDAVGQTIDNLGLELAATPEHQRPSKVIFVIVTDGEENSSRGYSYQAVAQRIAHQQEKYNWTFVFLGANQDAIKSACSLGIHSGNACNYGSTATSTDHSWGKLAKATRDLANNTEKVSTQTLYTDARLSQSDDDPADTDQQKGNSNGWTNTTRKS